jgi:hypothetical protein
VQNLRRKSVKILAFCAMSVPILCHDLAHAAEDFIEGLPDVPRLEMVTGIEGEPVIFDTPSGTVAEFTLILAATAEDAAEAYNAALTGLGWACVTKSSLLSCALEENRLVFTKPDNVPEGQRIILRLEPVE